MCRNINKKMHKFFFLSVIIWNLIMSKSGYRGAMGPARPSTPYVATSPHILGKVRARFLTLIQFKKFKEAENLAMAHFNEFTALMFAIDHNAEGLVVTLLQKGWNVNEIRVRDGNTPMFVAVGRKSLSMIKLLMRWGGEVNVTNRNGETPLMKQLLTHQMGIGLEISILLMSKTREEYFWVRSIPNYLIFNGEFMIFPNGLCLTPL